MISIKSISGTVIIEGDFANTAQALTAAIEQKADLTEADLTGANLTGTVLYGASLYRANLYRANLYRANLRGAYLYRANLYGANLYEANLTGADLTGANLRRGNLYGANLNGANLTGANLTGANIKEARFSAYSHIPEVGEFIGFKKIAWRGYRQALRKDCDVIAMLLIPSEARRTSCLISRKNRCEFAKVLSLSDGSTEDQSCYNGLMTVYKVGEMVYPDSYDDDIRVDCSHGIHFFITRKEAEEY